MNTDHILNVEHCTYFFSDMPRSLAQIVPLFLFPLFFFFFLLFFLFFAILTDVSSACPCLCICIPVPTASTKCLISQTWWFTTKVTYCGYHRRFIAVLVQLASGTFLLTNKNARWSLDRGRSTPIRWLSTSTFIVKQMQKHCSRCSAYRLYARCLCH